MNRNNNFPAILGLLITGLLGIAGVIALVVAQSYGAPALLFDLFVVVGIGLLAGYVVFCLLPYLRLLRVTSEAKNSARHTEEVIARSLEHLQAGKLTALGSEVDELPTNLRATFAGAVHALSTLIQQIQNSSIEVAGAGNGVQSTASELASGSSEQAAAVVEITATMEELARTAAQIAANAASQAQLSAQAEAAGNAGAAAVDDAAGGVEEVQKRIVAIAARADALGTRSKEIYRVLDLITEIAHETHILSLNAAIEAAAAGEHGRRFGVVADEVRRLAQRSQESVDSVRNLLDDFSGSIRATVVATEEGGKDASRVFERARAAASAIDELRDALAHTSSTARETSLATEQQRTASDQVVLTLKEVSQVIQRMAEGLQHFSGTADRLNHLALTIQLLTQSFHLDSPRSLKHIGEQWAAEIGAQAGHWEAIEGRLAEVVQANAFMEIAFLVGNQGAMLGFSVNPEWAAGRPTPSNIAIGASFADRPWFQAVMRDGHTIITSLYDSMLTGERCFTVATPVCDSHQAVVGVLGFDVNARGWTKI